MAIDWGQIEFEWARSEGRDIRLAVSGQIVALLVALFLGFPFAAAVAASAGLPTPFDNSETAQAQQPGDVPPDDQGDEHGQGQGRGTDQGGPDGQGTGRGNGSSTTTSTSPSTGSSSTTTPTSTTTTVSSGTSTSTITGTVTTITTTPRITLPPSWPTTTTLACECAP